MAKKSAALAAVPKKEVVALERVPAASIRRLAGAAAAGEVSGMESACGDVSRPEAGKRRYIAAPLPARIRA